MSFEPSFGIISKTLLALVESNSMSKTELSQRIGVNYSRLLRHLDWLSKKKIVALTVEKHKVVVSITPSGRGIAWIFIDKNLVVVVNSKDKNVHFTYK